MTDAPPTYDPEVDGDPEEHLRTVIGDWVTALQLEGTEPLVAASNLLGVLVSVLEVAMGRSAVRVALLMVFEKTFEQPMSFIERDETKKLLDQISNARRKVEGKPSLILPNDPTSH